MEDNSNPTANPSVYLLIIFVDELAVILVCNFFGDLGIFDSFCIGFVIDLTRVTLPTLPGKHQVSTLLMIKRTTATHYVYSRFGKHLSLTWQVANVLRRL